MRKSFYIILLFTVFKASSQNSKAKELYEKGQKEYTGRKYDIAAELFLSAIEKDSNYAEPYFKLGQIAESKRKEVDAIKYYQETLKKKPLETTFTQAYTYLGTRLLKKGEYPKAKEYLDFSLKNTSINSILYKQLSRQLESCEFSIQAKNKALSYKIAALSSNVNFKNRQYFPVLTADNEYIFYTARPDNGEENIYFSKWTGSEWTKAISISERINTKGNEGTCSISADGKIIVFTSCERNDTQGSCDLYYSKKVNGEWDAPINLGSSVNSPFWDSQPSLSNDGKTLYFSSDRPGGYGRKDLWMSELRANDNWTKAINLGKDVNTNTDEISPFIHANNKTLFFASDGHIGMGGLDLFMTEFKGGIYIKPENLGFPMNSHEDQVALFMSSDAKKGYYSVDEKTRTQIYEFEIPIEISDKFKKANYVKGIVIDAKTKAKISAEIELIDLKTKQIIEKIKSDNLTGEYMAVLPNGSQYALYVSKDNYFFKSLTFDYLEKTDADGKRIDILLEQFQKDVKEVLNNIFFDTGKYDLRIESNVELEKLTNLLKQNPSLKIEISGHTDDIGKDTDNQLLSAQRANSVVNYLIKNSINTQNIIGVGYGKNKPLVPNTTNENRAINRRIEMKIL